MRSGTRVWKREREREREERGSEKCGRGGGGGGGRRSWVPFLLVKHPRLLFSNADLVPIPKFTTVLHAHSNVPAAERHIPMYKSLSILLQLIIRI